MTGLISMIRVDHIPNPKDSYCLSSNGPRNLFIQSLEHPGKGAMCCPVISARI